jgi:raffinose/stachyose/melibiose transport system substrate-binding protein
MLRRPGLDSEARVNHRKQRRSKMKTLRLIGLVAVLGLFAPIAVACGPAATPQVVEKEVVVEKPVVETVVVEKEVVVEKPVVETVVVEKEVVVTPTPEPVKITFWTEFTAPPKTTVVDEWIAGFQQEYPWITVEHRGISNEVWEETLHTAMLGGEPPDVFVTESRAELMDYVDAGLVYDLTNWYDEHADRFVPGTALVNSVIRGRRYAIPWTVLVLDLIWYNTQIMDKYGLDPTTIETWDDLVAMCETLKQNGEVCFAFGGGGAGWTGGHWVMLLLQKNLTQEDITKLARREKKWTDPDVVAALSHFEEMKEKGYFAPGAAADDRDVGRALYFQGQGAFWQAGSWHLYEKGGDLAPPGWEFEFIPFPNFAGAAVQDVSLVGGNVQWTISSQTKHLDEALLFLEYITRLENAERWVELAQEFLAVKGAVNENTAGPEMVAIAEYLEASNPVDFLELYIPTAVRNDGHWAGAQGILSGQITTQEWAELIDQIHEAEGALSLE